jgi:hypothetical protein
MIATEVILQRKNDFESLCKGHHVKYLYLFGSATSNLFDPLKSDIDLLVELDISSPIERGEMLLSLWDGFESFFNRKVDMLTAQSIKNPYLGRSIEATKQLIYDGTKSKILV